MNHFFCLFEVYKAVMDYLEPIVHLLEIECQAFKNLLRSGFWGNLFCFSHGHRCTDCDVLISLFCRRMIWIYNIYLNWHNMPYENKMAANSQKLALKQFFRWFLFTYHGKRERDVSSNKQVGIWDSPTTFKKVLLHRVIELRFPQKKYNCDPESSRSKKIWLTPLVRLFLPKKCPKEQ